MSNGEFKQMCPLLSIGNLDGEFTFCQEIDCMWWNSAREVCTMKTAGMSLERLYQLLLAEREGE